MPNILQPVCFTAEIFRFDFFNVPGKEKDIKKKRYIRFAKFNSLNLQANQYGYVLGTLFDKGSLLIPAQESINNKLINNYLIII